LGSLCPGAAIIGERCPSFNVLGQPGPVVASVPFSQVAVSEKFVLARVL